METEFTANYAQRMEQVLDRVRDLPALPAIASRVLQLTEDPSCSISDITEVVQQDPALTAKILRVSNSPYYGMRQYVGTLKLALVILGIREVRNIILGVSVIETLRDEKAEGLLAKDFWQHSIAVAAMARKLGAYFKLAMHGEAFVSGLLHDIGKLVLARYRGKVYGPIYRASGGAGEPLCALERKTFGFTHAHAAAALGTRWSFPRTLIDSLLMHHHSADQPMEAAKDPELAAVVRLADLAARHDFSVPGPKAFDTDDAMESWQHIGPAGRQTVPEKRCDLLGELMSEIQQIPLSIF